VSNEVKVKDLVETIRKFVRNSVTGSIEANFSEGGLVSAYETKKTL